MRLATLRSGARDGRLCVVSRDLAWVAPADDIAPTLQGALDDWASAAPRLAERSEQLEAGRAPRAQRYDPAALLAPLPRAYQWIDAGGYMSHMMRMRAARNAPMPARWETEPAMYQGLSDTNLAATDDIIGDPAWGIDLEAELAVIVDDVPRGASPAEAAAAIRLIVLLNDISLRRLIPDELAKGFGFLWGKPASAFAPVAVTPDEFGADWADGKAICRVRVEVNGERLGEPWAGVDQQFSFPRIIEHATKTRALAAGSVVGAGTISNHDASRGVSCLVEQHVLQGHPGELLHPGDHVLIEAFDRQGASWFGAIDQRVVGLEPAGSRPRGF